MVNDTQSQDSILSTVYISSARLQREDEIVDILRVSRKNNEQAGLTGLLAYKDGNFLQILEGPKEKV
ncbi:MAG: BLUF domain-containing protein, partial [Acidobacteriota bacterium]|nr:BLUF domain-containing protein [Acidobacteriota bacterium]